MGKGGEGPDPGNLAAPTQGHLLKCSDSFKCSHELTASNPQPPLCSHSQDASLPPDRPTLVHILARDTHTHQPVDTHSICSHWPMNVHTVEESRPIPGASDPYTPITVLERRPENYRPKSVMYSHRIHSHDYSHVRRSQAHMPSSRDTKVHLVALFSAHCPHRLCCPGLGRAREGEDGNPAALS